MEIIKYREERAAADKYKAQYADGLERLIKSREKEFAEKRSARGADIFNNQEKYRDEFKKMLGWPLTEKRAETMPNVISEKLSEEEKYTVYRMQLEILEGVYLSGLFFKTKTDKRPFVIAQHGGLGTPELVAGFYGSTTNYNDLITRILQFDCNVFAPQLYVWGLMGNNDYSLDCDRQALDARLKRVGSSVTAVEIHGIERVIDYFEKQPYVTSIGMAGLSYGGFYTLFTAAADTRIKAALSCSYYNDRDKYFVQDWTWSGSAEFADACVACLVYPRKLTLMSGTDDKTFTSDGFKAEIESLKKLSAGVGDDWFNHILFEGVHEFIKDDAPIKEFMDSLLEESK